MDVSIIIVNYNTRELTLQCLKSIYEQTAGLEFEIIVVDNSSSDNSCTAIKSNFPKVLLIESDENLGFGKANNLGAKSAKGKYIFLLNSDCLLLENTIKAFYDFMEDNNSDESIGAVGAMLFEKDLNQNSSYRKFSTKSGEIYNSVITILNKILGFSIKFPKTSNYKLSFNIDEVDSITGADLFILKKIFNKLNGFDEQFFMYFEETDLQKRMELIGLKRIILSEKRIIHYEGASTINKNNSLKHIIFFRDSMYKYFKKHSNYILYITFYLIITPLLIYPLLAKKYSAKEKREYKNMLLRKSSVSIT